MKKILLTSLLVMTGCTASDYASFMQGYNQGQAIYHSTAYHQPAPQPEAYTDTSGIDGALLISQDGTFLGKITTNELDPDSITNELGRFGSELSQTSIRNEFSPYGSPFSKYSAYNELATDPPLIFLPDRTFVGYLTKNELKQPAIDPDSLLALLRGEI